MTKKPMSEHQWKRKIEAFGGDPKAPLIVSDLALKLRGDLSRQLNSMIELATIEIDEPEARMNVILALTSAVVASGIEFFGSAVSVAVELQTGRKFTPSSEVAMLMVRRAALAELDGMGLLELLKAAIADDRKLG